MEVSDSRIPETKIFECELVLTCLPDDFIESETASDINTDMHIKKASGKASTDLLSFIKCQMIEKEKSKFPAIALLMPLSDEEIEGENVACCESNKKCSDITGTYGCGEFQIKSC